MSVTILYTLVSVIVVSLVSLIGIVFFLFEEGSIRQYLLYLVSLSTGALLGDVFIHIVPEIAQDPETLPSSFAILLGGILFSFALEKLIHWRHCHVLSPDHGHHHPMGAVNLVGESIHNFIDGLAIAAGFLVSIPVGLATTLAVMLHEIPQEIGDFAVLLQSGYSKKRALFFNLLSALTAIAGAVLVLLSAASEGLSTFMLPFAAGNLLYIAGSDLIPELHKESRLPQGALQLLCIIAGMLLMYGLKVMEG